MAPNVQKVSDLRGNNRPIDPDVVIPEAVRRATERAEAAHKSAYKGAEPEPAPTPAPAGDNIQIAPDNAPAPQPPTAPPVTQSGNEPPTPQPVTPTPPTDEDWQQKFRSAEGRRAQLQNQLNTAADRISVLEQMVHELQQAPSPAPVAATPAQLALITDKEREEFGEDMLAIMGKRAQEIVSPEVSALKEQVRQLTDKLNGTVTSVATNARASMLQKLDEALPEWKQINVRPEFKSWLSLPDPLFGVSRHGALLQAFEKNDTSRVLNFFKGFVSELAAGAPAEPTPAGDPPAPAPAKPSLDSLAAPGRARTSAQPGAPAEKQIITTADISAFYAAKRRGEYAGREAEVAQLEAELFAAQREGRVRAV